MLDIICYIVAVVILSLAFLYDIIDYFKTGHFILPIIIIIMIITPAVNIFFLIIFLAHFLVHLIV